MTVTTIPHGGTGGAHAHRVIFIDLGRFLALVFMLYGHTVSALLAPEYQQGTWFEIWNFQRGLTSSLFLILSGFAFSIATSRRWGSHQAFSPAVLKRMRRFALFLLLGYAIHFPVPRFSMLTSLTDEQWRDAFRAGGYESGLADRFIRSLKKKVAQGLALRATS